MCDGVMAARRGAMLVAALLLATGGGPLALDNAEPTIWVHAVPTGYAAGRFTALVQITVMQAEDGQPWELSGKLVAGGSRGRSFGGSVTARDGTAVLEQVVEFAPGTSEVLAQATNASTGVALSRKVEWDWPDPQRDEPTVGPIALLQEARGNFRRGEASRSSGSLTQPRSRPLRSDAPSALLGIVCGGRSLRGTVTVARHMLGRSEMHFEDIRVDFDASPCAILQDLIPPSTLTPGFYRYQIVIRDGEREAASGYRAFSAR